MARLSKSIWNDPDWRALSAPAQLLALVCIAVGATGPCTTARIARKTGWDAKFIEMTRNEVQTSPYANVLVGRLKRRKLPRSLVRSVFERDQFKCQSCGSDAQLSIDHVHPVSRGGSDDAENLQTLCLPCNLRKGARVA
ncbi:MAG TPA: HNH endonuclease [Candidatus Lumbricidophila sp.]|nr:HNH endonuclease [Candidatus Lumbricidophila sp.]